MDQFHSNQKGGDNMSTAFSKALIFELDGTAISKKPKAVPSKAVVEALMQARERVVILFATNRNWKSAKDTAKALQIQYPCVTLGGSQVVDPTTNKVIWEQDLDPGVPAKIIDIAKAFDAKVFNYDLSKYISPKSYKIKPVEPIIVLQVNDKSAQEMLKQIKKIPLLNVETSHSLEKGFTQINVKHIHATKFMALQTISKKLKLNPKECIGVGDAAADITLLNFCGIKVAMGNATSRLKELAQYIAPTIEQDGLAWVVQKFVLS